jgi:hypothetical protein
LFTGTATSRLQFSWRGRGQVLLAPRHDSGIIAESTLVPQQIKPNWYPFWSPRFWHGMRLPDYLRLLRRNRFAIHPARLPLALTVAAMSGFNSIWSTANRLLLGSRIKQTELKQPPIFIVGHWRTGTTLLHELLACDPQFAFPTNYDCFVPHHFPLTKRLFSPLINLFLPGRRPMDDMRMDANSPQEDEFALFGLGAPTIYSRMAFPNHRPTDIEMLDLRQAPSEKLERFRAALELFFKSLTYHYSGRRLILKSPTHTGRIETLAHWYPGAKFIHLSRHPFAVFESTLRLWRSLDLVQGLQLPKYSQGELEDFVFDILRRMYDAYLVQRDRIPVDDLLELKFEELVATPEPVIERVYDQLGLGPVEPIVRKNLADYQHRRQGHIPKSKPPDPATELRIKREWAIYFDAFGYEPVAPQPPQPAAV